MHSVRSLTVPELAALEHQLSSIHLPAIDGNEALHSLSELSLPEVNLERLEHLRPDISQAIAGFEWPAWLAMLDIGGSRARAARAARIRSQTLWLGGVGGLIVVGLGVLAILGSEPLRGRLQQALGAIRTKVATMRARTDEGGPMTNAMSRPPSMPPGPLPSTLRGTRIASRSTGRTIRQGSVRAKMKRGCLKRA